MHALKGLPLPRASHFSEIALTGSRRLHTTLAAAPVLFAHAVVTATLKLEKYSAVVAPNLESTPKYTKVSQLLQTNWEGTPYPYYVVYYA